MSDIVKFRQGDVLVTRIEEFPAGLEPVDRDRGRIVLAYGEVTGPPTVRPRNQKVAR